MARLFIKKLEVIKKPDYEPNLGPYYGIFSGEALLIVHYNYINSRRFFKQYQANYNIDSR